MTGLDEVFGGCELGAQLAEVAGVGGYLCMGGGDLCIGGFQLVFRVGVPVHARRPVYAQ